MAVVNSPLQEPAFRCGFCDSVECGFDEHQETGALRASCDGCGVSGQWRPDERSAVEALCAVMPKSRMESLLARLQSVKACSNSDPDAMAAGLDQIAGIISTALAVHTGKPPAHLSRYFSADGPCCPSCGCTILFDITRSEEEEWNPPEDDQPQLMSRVECSQCKATWTAHLALVEVSDLHTPHAS